MSDTRITLLSVIDYFFCRSHAFRSRIVDDIQGLLKLVCETDPLHCPLPGPTHKAKQLKVYAIKRIKAWHEKFGPGYIKLQGVPEFLKVQALFKIIFLSNHPILKEDCRIGQEKLLFLFLKYFSNFRNVFSSRIIIFLQNE